MLNVVVVREWRCHSFEIMKEPTTVKSASHWFLYLFCCDLSYVLSFTNSIRVVVTPVSDQQLFSAKTPYCFKPIERYAMDVVGGCIIARM